MHVVVYVCQYVCVCLFLLIKIMVLSFITQYLLFYYQ